MIRRPVSVLTDDGSQRPWIEAERGALREQATVELTSPTTTTRSGRSARRTFSNATMIFAVCSACDPDPTSRCRSGAGIPSYRKKMSDMVGS